MRGGRFTILGSLLTTAILSGMVGVATAQHRLTLEVVTDLNVPRTATQDWARKLNGIGFDSVRLRTGTSSDKPSVEERGTPPRVNYHVTAFLSSKNELWVPGASFKQSEISKLKKWAEKLSIGGEQELSRKPGAFGMTKEEQDALKQKLETTITWSTTGGTVADLLRKFGQETGVEFKATGEATARMRQVPLVDQLQGFSAGTAMAIALRSASLGISPEREVGGKQFLMVAMLTEERQFWPLGWAPTDNPANTAPALFQFIEVEIMDTPVTEAVAAIGARVKVPILLDHSRIALQEIDLAEAKVKFPKRRTFYKNILDNLLFQVKLTMDLKVDENGKPFLWVTPIRRS